MKYKFETYDNNEDIKGDILNLLEKILKDHDCIEIKMPVFTCMNELLVNAIKANFKNLYFEEYSPNNNALEIIPYHKALQLFKLEMSTNRVDYLLQLAKEKNVKATIEIEIDEENVLKIVVRNPALMTEVESQNIQKKIEVANKFETLTEYFILSEEDPNKEGGGLGLIFILMMLKSFGLEMDRFCINSEDNETIASLAIPLTAETRNQYISSTQD